VVYYHPAFVAQKVFMKLTRFRILVLTLWFMPGAFAGVIELIASGHVTDSSASSIPVGTTLTAYVFFDPTSTPLSTSSSDGFSRAAYLLPSASILVFGSSMITGDLHQLNVDVGVPLENPLCCVRGGDDGMEWTSLVATVTGPFASDPKFSPGGLNPFYVWFEAPHTKGVLTSTTLPSTFPGFPGQWTDASFFLVFAGGISGTIEAVTVATPEPRTLPALVLTLLIVLLSRIKRKRTAYSATSALG
jgi:hypothetical protein